MNDKGFDTAFLKATNRLPFLDWSGLMKLRFAFFFFFCLTFFFLFVVSFFFFSGRNVS